MYYLGDITIFGRLRALGAAFLLAVATLTGVPLLADIQPALAQTCPAGTTATSIEWGNAGGNEYDWLDNDANAASTVTNVYPDIGSSTIDMSVTMSDPFNRNMDNNNPLEASLGNEQDTGTDSFYGPEYLTISMNSLDSTEILSWSFDFSKPVYLDGFQISDLDWTGEYTLAPDGSGDIDVESSFEDELILTTVRGGTSVPPVATLGAGLTQTGSTILATGNGGYAFQQAGLFGPADADARVTLTSSEPTTSLTFGYSNGPNDAALDSQVIAVNGRDPWHSPPVPADPMGVSDSHAIAISAFTVCVGSRTIGDTVWADVDNDGFQDPNEPGVGGVAVELRDSDGNVVDTTTTLADGSYIFTEVMPFDWTVGITAPANYSLGFDRDGGADGAATIPTADLIAGNVADADFGLVPDPGTVSGQVFEDYDNDGIFDAGDGEVGIENVTINLIGTDLGDNAVNLSTTTAADGTYSFPAIPAGTYTVSEVQPSGYVDGIDTAGTGNTVVSNDNILVGLDPLESSAGNNFAETPDSSLTGTVFEDLNNDGTQNGSETGIANVTVTLENETSGATLTTTTAADGSYTFAGFGPGTYTVTETQPAGFLDGQDTVGDQGGTLGNDVVTGIVLAPNEDATGYNFGEIPGTSISGSVVDEDGTAIPGVTITLTGTNDLGAITPIVITTASDGSYAFTDLRPGDYTVTETQPATHGDGGETAGSGGGTVADDEISGIVLNAGDNSTGNNFDEVTGSIAGSVVDEAGNPIAGVTVALTGTEAAPSGAAVNQNTTTAADGSYSFDNVLGGSYTLTETQPSGYGDGTEVAGTAGGAVDNTPGVDTITGITLTGGQNATGYDYTELLSSISGTVFLDEDNSGTQDLPGDNGIAGVTITLTDGGSISRTATTDSDGNYSFANLPAGTYTVTETQPGNYVDGTDTAGSAGGTVGADTISGVVVTGSPATGYNFAELPSAGISGSVVDDDGNPISGVLITLTGTNDLGASVTQTYTTAADGLFVFFGLRGGTYAITESQPTGYGNGTNVNGTIPGTPGTNTFTAITLGPDDVSNGFVFEETRGSIAGSVIDTAGNPIAGVSMTLSGTDDLGNSISTTTSTNGSGAYAFDDLFSGTYTITEAQPAGYQDGTDVAGTAGGTAVNPGDEINSIGLSGGQNATGYQFVEELGALSGEVYEDLNANGVRDAGEPGIAGVEVTLTGTDLGGSAITPRTVATNALGQYVFDNLEGGTYTLTETQPSAFVDGQDRAGLAGGTPGTTAGSDVITGITLPLGQSSQGYTFGEVEPNSIAGKVFLDPNNDGAQQAGETGLGGVELVLTGTDDFGVAVSVTTTTASDGTYGFPGLRPGTYVVTETQPAGNIDGIDTVGSAGGSNAVNDVLSAIALTSDLNATGYDFAELEGASIAGSVTDDQGDPIAGVTINWSGTTDTGTSVSGSVTTAADGTYVVGSLRPGTYTIVEVQPSAYGDGGQTAGTSAGDDTSVNDEISGIVLSSGDTATGYDFDETTGSLAGTVFNDLNGNGVREGGESGIAGVDVELDVPDGSGGTTTLTTTTNGTGDYVFTGLVANGPMVVREPTQPAGFADGAETLGNAATPGSLPGTDDDTMGAIQLSGGQDATGYNFGEVESASISGTVVADDDGDGVADAGEAGIAGVELTLTGTDALGRTVSETTTTNGSGDYTFGSLYPGAYTITETQPAAFFDGGETAGSAGGTVSANDTISGISVASGDDATDYDFGELEAASIAGEVVDTLGNPIAGVTLTLTGGASPVSVVTNAAGQYVFNTLVPGTYTITETQPSAYGDGGEAAGSAGGDDSVDDVISAITVGSAEAATGYNFTETLGSLSGLVYEDSNANLAFDVGEPGISGVDVTITDSGGTPTTVQTAADGSFTFPNLVGGVFTLTESQPSGYADGNESAGTAGGVVGNDVMTGVSLAGGQDAVDYRFGEVLESSIAGSVLDENGAPIAGVEIAFAGTDYRGTPVTGSVLTQTDGTYTIANLRPGTYAITETQPASYGDGTTTAGTAGGDDSVSNTVTAIVLGSNVDATGYDFTETLGSIAGVVYDDLNANGVLDGSETGLSGVDVTLTGGTAPVTVVTDGSGAYLFDDLLAGTYTVTEPTQPAGLLDGQETAGTSGGTPGTTVGSDAIAGIGLAGGVDSTDNNFGEVQPSSLAGTVVLDSNNNGLADASETGLAGVDLTLTGTDDFGQPVAVTIQSGADGTYTFAAVRPGTYTLTETQPISNIDGSETPGTAGGTVTANDTISGIAIAPGTAATDYDFGELEGSSIMGTVRDEAGNPIGGVTITLTGTDDLGVITPVVVTTAADGTYAFGGLRPGDYTVTESQPVGYGDGGNNVLPVALVSGEDVADVDFLETLGSLAGSVYEDLNANGVRDVGEPGIPGVLVALSGTDAIGGTVSLSATTTATGGYSFDDLLGGSYDVSAAQAPFFLDGVEASPTGTIGNDTITGIVLPGGDDIAPITFGEVRAAQIRGTVVNDTDNDGVADGGEIGIAGVDVTLTGVDDLGATITPSTSTTDASGNYLFVGLRPGTYTVTESQPAAFLDGAETPGSAGGTVSANDVISSIPLASGTISLNNDFGELPASSISGTVTDEIGNPIPNTTITLTGTDDLGPITPVVLTTDASGDYNFVGLRPGSYTVAESQPTGYGDGGNNALSVSVSTGQTSAGNDFVETLGSVAALVFQDDNNDGVVDTGEPGLAGVEVVLSGTDDLGNPVSITLPSAADGTVLFDNLISGTYTVTETQPPAFIDGLDTAPAATGTAGNDVITGVVVAGGEDIATATFGEIEAAQVSGTVTDEIGNPIPGVTITLSGIDDLGNSVSVTATTAGDGTYTIPGLRPGNYDIVESQPAGYGDGGGNTISVSLGSGDDSTGNDFNELLGSLSGLVFNDTNNDGIIDTGDTGIASVTITLVGTDANGSAVSVSTTSAADGSYAFDDLVGGTYVVSQPTQPSGVLDGIDSAPLGVVGNDAVTGVVLGGGADLTEFNFGEIDPASLSGSVVIDDDNDGVADTGEVGIDAVTLTITGTDDRGAAVSGTTTTGSDGSFTLADLRPGTYTVTETQPAAFLDGLETPGSGGGTVTANDTISGIAVSVGDALTDYDFGEIAGSSITGTVRDEAGNPIENTTITLTGTDDLGNPVNLTATTAADGTYGFPGLRPGDYTVTETQPVGYGDGGNNVISGISISSGGSSADNDFVETLGSVSAQVFIDTNNDGVVDGTEIGIAGVDLTLSGTDDLGNPVNVTISSAADGTVVFDDLISGTYTITESQPAAFADGIDAAPAATGTAGNDVINGVVVGGGEDIATATFGELEGASIAGTVAVDDGSLLGGVTITLTGTDDLGASVNVSTTTAADGTYSFGGLRPGDYTVSETQPIGYGSADANTQSVIVASGDDVTGVDFTETLGSISGSVYEDLNANGVRDAAEPGISGVLVALIGTDAVGNPVSLSATTNGTGAFDFGDLLGGTYDVSAAQAPLFLDGVEASPAGTVGNDTITGIVVPGGDDIAPITFGEVAAARISGTVVSDTDNDGVADGGESGIDTVDVTLTGVDDLGATIAPVTVSTDSSGNYLFAGLRPGTYTVTESQPAAFLDGAETPGSAGGTVSANDVISGIVLGSGTIALNYDFGELPASTISGTVTDEIGNPIPNTTITLTGTDDLGDPVSIVITTDPSGNYIFPNLRPGTYEVAESQPTGYGDGGNNVITPIVITPGSSSSGNDFVETLGSVTAVVFEDINNNGDIDPGENGIEGVEVNLDGTDDLGNPVNLVLWTDATGSVVFDNLISGTYTVTEQQPSSFVDGADTAPTSTGTAGDDVITDVVVGGGEDIGTATFGELRTAVIDGTVRDTAGRPIVGVLLTLTGTDDLGNAVTRTATTTAAGFYQFGGDLRPGTYTVTETQPAGYGDGDGTVRTPLEVGPNEAINNVDFVETLGSISGSVYDDLNANGFRDAGEPGIAGVPVDLTGSDANGAVVSLSATTAADGGFAFDDLVGGTYELAETQPVGFVDGQEATGGNGTAPQDDTIVAIALGGGEDLAGFTFGEVRSASLSGTVVTDLDNDGVADGGETGIGGVTLTLTGTDDLGAAVNLTASTIADGTYEFSGLRPGTYTITETQPPTGFDGNETAGSAGGTVSANDTISGIVLGSGDIGTAYDFGELPAATVAGTVVDEIANPIVNVTLTLTGTDDLGNPVTLTTTTAADGTYAFGPLRPGSYTVTESQPTGYGDGGNNTIDVVLSPGDASVGNDFTETLGSLAGGVFEDLNVNGVRDLGEPGISGVLIALSGTDALGAAVTASATTDVDGNYVFDNLIGGSYDVAAAQNAAFLDGDDSAPAGTVGNDVVTAIPLAGGADLADINFGELRAGQIRGTVVNDTDNDGVADGGESGIAGVALTLTGTDDRGAAVSASATTNALGNYLFIGLRPGTYTVAEAQPAAFLDGNETPGSGGGSIVANDTIGGITLESGTTAVDNDFGELPAGSIAGSVADEAGNPIVNVTLTLSGTDDQGNAVSVTVTTNASGDYSFPGLRPGDYVVTESQPSGYGDGGSNTLAIALAPGEASVDNDFLETLGSISAAVFEDLDADGSRDGGEPAIAGVEVTLTGTDVVGNAVSIPGTTGADGRVVFDDLVGGTYTLTETQPGAYIDGLDAAPGAPTAPNGTAGNDLVTGIVLVGGEDISEATFGEVLGASVAGTVFIDADNDGVLDTGEGFIGGVTVVLTGTDDLGASVSLSLVTAIDGTYDFGGLRPGTYTVTETQPVGYLDGTGDVLAAITVGSGEDSTGNDFGELEPASISGAVTDTAGNPISGVTITLTGTDDQGNPVSLTTTTAADGSYSFGDLRPGDYSVVEDQPVGYGDGGSNILAITLTPRESSTGNDFVETLGSLSGIVFIDTDGDGVQGGTEVGAAGVQIVLTDGLGGTTSATTAADGTYSFADLIGGSYTVSEVQPATFLDGADIVGTGGGLITANDVISGAVVPDGGDITGYDFAELPASSISGMVEDEISNPIAGVTLTLVGTDDLGATVTLTTTTAADGTYTFGPLRPGTYEVTESQPIGYGDGGNNVIGGITVAPDTAVTGIDFVETLGSVSGVVYDDLNADATRDTGEPGIASVELTLSGTDANGDPVTVTTTTGIDGTYTFDNVIGGTYSIVETQPAGFVDGIDTPGTSGGTSAGTDEITSISLAGGVDATGYLFGEVRTGSISGSVVVDLDNDGQADVGEAGILGVAVDLTGTDDLGAAVNLSTSTAVDGSYRFDALRPGNYTVTAAQDPAFFDGAETAGSSGGTVSANDTISGIALGSGDDAVDYDFGELPAAAVNGTVLDEAGNPISNVTITLTGTDDQGNPVSLSVTTGLDGTYSIPGLRPGGYTVTETQPLGYGDGPPNSFPITLTPGATETVDFVDELASIAGSVIDDTNNNGTREPSDSGLVGVVIQLTGTDVLGNVINVTTTTASDGTYSFGDLIAGTYTLTELTEPAGFLDGADSGPSGTPGTNINGRDEIASLTLAAGADATDFVFGEVQAASVAATVFEDVDNDGVIDGSEIGIASVPVALSGTDDRGASVTLTGTTNGAGDVVFSGLRPGTYVLTQTQPASFGDGLDNSGTAGVDNSVNDVLSNIVVGSGESSADNTFGEIPLASISGAVGDTAGRPIGGVTITVTGTDDLGNPVSITTTTLADGTYSVPGLRPGVYDITESQPAGYGDGGTNVLPVTLAPGETKGGNDFVETLGSFAGLVFEDTNNDGIKQSAEPAIGSASIFLTGTDANGSAVSESAVTLVDGTWIIDDLVGGVYTITEAQPAGFIDGIDTVGTAGGTLGNDVISAITLGAAEDATGYTFGEIDVASISGAVTDDLGRPIAGVTIDLNGTDDTGVPIALTVTTGLDGVYSFNGLRPGTYTVIETQPVGYGDGPETVGDAGGANTANDELSGIVLAPNEDAAGYDFSETTSSLSATVFEDTDNDGVSDPAESGIGSIAVTISGTDDRGNAVTITIDSASDGTVTFDGLVSGTYSVSAAQSPAHLDGSDTAGSAGGTAGNDVITGIVLGIDTDAVDYDFGELPGASISGTVSDENGSPIPGVTITVDGTDDLGNPVLLTVTTGSDGTYSVPGLRPGTYDVTQTQPPGYGSVTPNAVPVTLNPGETETVDFVESFGSLAGVVFEDSDGDGGFDFGEAGIGGVSVSLIGTDVNGAPVSAALTTAPDGTFVFDDLIGGTYSLVETQPAGYEDGTDAAGTAGGTPVNPGDLINAIVLAGGVDATGYTFGEVQPSSLSGSIVVDSDNDGMADPAETGIAGVTVTLTGTDDLGNSVVATATTAADGSYTFPNLRPGTYQIVADQDISYLDGNETAGSAGGDLTADDPVIPNDTIAAIVLGSGDEAIGYDFGELPAASISGTVADEAGNSIPGVTITVDGTDDLGNPVSITVLTGPDGSYDVPGLRPGTYTVTQTQPPGYGNGSPNVVPVTLDPGETEMVDFLETLGSISGVVFDDLNGDGAQNAGEPGIGSVAIDINGTDVNGNPVAASATTDSDGTYDFDDLVGGTYTVTETQPGGFLDGSDIAGSAGGDVTVNDVISAISLPAADDATGYDFAEIAPASLAGNVRTGDGSPIEGVIVTLTGTDDLGNPVSTTFTTGPDGTYEFSDLRPGTYTITEATPAGYGEGGDSPGTLGGTVAVSEISGIDVTPGDIGVEYNFIDTLGSLSGLVFHDVDEDDVFGGTDAGIVGVAITLTGTDVNGASVDITINTAGDGTFVFTDLLQGTYAISETQPFGFTDSIETAGDLGGDVSIDDVISAVTIGAGQIGSGYTFAETGNVLSGQVFLDNNGNGVRDPEDTRFLDGVIIELLDATGTVIRTTSTDSSGGYLFDGIPVGDYTIRQTQPVEWGSSSPNEIAISVNGGGQTGLDFAEKPGSISGVVFSDVGNDGTSSGDSAVVGIDVNLLDAAGAVIATATTAADGSYGFVGLEAGSYSVQLVAPSGQTFSPQETGSDDLIDSDFDPATGAVAVPLAPGEDRIRIDAGITPIFYDLSIEVTVPKTDYRVNENVPFSVVVTNESNAPTPDGLTVTVPLPAGSVLDSATGDGWTITRGGSVLTAVFVGTLAPGEVAPPISIVVKRATVGALSLPAEVRFNSGVVESNADNNRDSAIVEITSRNLPVPVPSLPVTGVTTAILVIGGGLLMASGRGLLFFAGKKRDDEEEDEEEAESPGS